MREVAERVVFIVEMGECQPLGDFLRELRALMDEFPGTTTVGEVVAFMSLATAFVAATGDISSQRGQMLRVQGAQRGHELSELTIPARFEHVPADFPRGDPYNVGQMYALFAEGIRTGKPNSRLPTFDTAVELHHFIDTIQRASDMGQALAVSAG